MKTLCALALALALIASQTTFAAAPTTLCPELNGKWEGRGANVYYGEYNAAWIGTCSLEKTYEFLKGELVVTPIAHPDLQIRFHLSATKYSSTYSSPIIMKLTEINPKTAIPLPGIGEEETLYVTDSSTHKLIGWRQVDLNKQAAIARGLRLELDSQNVLNFGFIFSETFCDQGDGAFKTCVSDRYSPFRLSKKLP